MPGLELCSVNTRAWASDCPTTDHGLFRFSKVIDGICVETHHAHRVKRRELLGNDLGRVHDIESEAEGLALLDDLDVELPFRVFTRLDGVKEILAVKVRILACDMLGFVPNQAGLALLGLPVPLDEFGIAVVGDKAECVDSEPVLITESIYHSHMTAGI